MFLDLQEPLREEWYYAPSRALAASAGVLHGD